MCLWNTLVTWTTEDTFGDKGVFSLLLVKTSIDINLHSTKLTLEMEVTPSCFCEKLNLRMKGKR